MAQKATEYAPRKRRVDRSDARRAVDFIAREKREKA